MKTVTIKMTEKELKEVNKILGSLGKKIEVEPCEHEYEELKEEGPNTYEINSNGAGYIFIHHDDFEDANIESNRVNMFANKTDIYLTDLEKDEIEWNGVEVEFWGNVARNFAGDFDIDITDVWECVNPFGDTATVNISDHLINIHYDGVEDDEQEKIDDLIQEVKQTDFVVMTDAEGRGTINKKILQAANLCPDEDSGWYFNIFTNDSGTKLYITWKEDNYLEFNGEECKKIKEYFSNGKTSLRIKLGKSYVNYPVHVDEDKELITIDTSYNDCAEVEEEKEDVVTQNTINEIVNAVDVVKKLTGIDLSKYFSEAIQKVLNNE